MHYWKGCIVLIGIFINAFQICGLQINFPQNNVGNYGESTEMNCTEAALDVSKGYNWYKDGSIIYNSVTGDATSTGKYTSSHGTDYFTLVITNTALNDNGVYRCNYNFQDDSDTLVIQAKGKFRTKLDCSKTVKEVEISWIDFYPNTATISSVKSKKGMTIPGNASTPVANGDFFNMTWTSANIDISDVKDGLDIEIDSLQDFSDFANITSTNTSTTCFPETTTTTTPTTTSTTTTTTPPPTTTSTTTTTIPPPTTTSTTTTTIPPTAATATTKITKPMPASTYHTSSTTTSQSTTAKLASNDGLSKEEIIVVSVVPVAFMIIIGIIIALVCYKRKGKKLPASHQDHKHRNHHKENKRQVLEYMQEPYSLYGKHYTLESHHKEIKRSNLPYNNNSYNLYRSQVTLNPLNRFSRESEPYLSYYNGQSSKYADYMPRGYTKGHVYPSHSRRYQSHPENQRDFRYVPYPEYSRQQQHHNLSFSYMGY